MKSLATSLALLVVLATPCNAQWLNQPTPNIPRTADGKPDLTAPPPRTADGHPDLSGNWQGRPIVFARTPGSLTPSAQALIRAREENYFRERPTFQCKPTGPEVVAGWKRIDQTPTLITIYYDDLTYRRVFMDGRKLERDPERVWMGYSVGRWEGDTLVVDSFGFNDRTWLDARGTPHTEALRTTERYRRATVGRMQVELTATDPGTFTAPQTLSYPLEFRPDTEMIEAVCEEKQDHWVGSLSENEKGAVTVAPAVLAKYVGVYSGLWGTVPRTVRVTLAEGALYATGLVGDNVRLIPHSDTFFLSTDGLTYTFGGDGGKIDHVVERHVSGDWKYARQP
ncbi:MAG: hypothetical protein ABI640_21345 [Gammaproteobacteria bacterium]